MIQRVQSIYLLIATISLALLFVFPIWTATMPMVDLGSFQFNITDYPILMFLSGAGGALSLITIMLFKNRPLQARLSLLSMVVGIIIVGMIYFYTKKLDNPLSELMTVKMDPGAFMPILAIVFSFLAYRGIIRDEKLVRSMDRLR